jgi:hypothetical protein
MACTKKSLLIHSGVLLSLCFLLIAISHQLVLTRDFFSKSGQALAATTRLDVSVYASLNKWFYLYESFYLAAKLSLVTLILYTALYLVGQQVSYLQLLDKVIVAEFAFCAGAAAKLAYFYWYCPGGTLADWQRTYVGSALSFFPGLPANWSYAVQSLNVFEVAYWGLLAAGISRLKGLAFGWSLRLVLCSYLPAILLWIICISFCAVLLFPHHS